MNAFPKGFPYKKPKPLLYGLRINWVYQPEQSLHETLRRELRMHYKYYLDGVVDKTFILIYLFLSGTSIFSKRLQNYWTGNVILESDKFIPGTNKSPEGLVHPGLISYQQIDETQSGCLVAPYILIWILMQSSDGKRARNKGSSPLTSERESSPPIPQKISFSSSEQGGSYVEPILHYVERALFTSNFGNTLNISSFRTLKSIMLDDNEATTIAKIHTGENLNELKIAIHQEDTNSAHYTGRDDLNSNDPNPNEEHQYNKLKRKILNESEIQIEWEKSSLSKDFFLIFTTTKINNIRLPRNTGYVDASNRSPLDINTAVRKQLELVKGVGTKRAEIIYNNRKFKDIEALIIILKKSQKEAHKREF
ncbi:3782_t:CDS:2 [Funneliformis geosporum]|nr:3782_t:CDS:2 [Funneliformis geosporum]